MCGATYIFQLSRAGPSWDSLRGAWTTDGGRAGGRTRSSWLRELMASLAKTLLKWYWTVCTARMLPCPSPPASRERHAARRAVPGTAQVADRLALQTAG